MASTTKIMVTRNYFMVHPAFTSDVNVGGWDTELEGIWVGKYETSLANREDGSNIRTYNGTQGNLLISENSDKAIAIQPNFSSWRYITIGNMYTNSKEYSEELNSHLIKNSEWGAMAYLSYSCYGRNGTPVSNNNNTFNTGYATETTSDGTETSYEYNTEKGMLASSTGNVYGIYDICGGAYDAVSGYYNGDDIDTSSLENASSFATIGGSSDKYTTVFNSTGANSYTQNYIYGDATYEIQNFNRIFKSWVTSSSPFLGRGGHGFQNKVQSCIGAFSFNNITVSSISGATAFRICLAM